MESALYKSIFAKGEARAHAATIYKHLVRWLGSVDASVRQHIATFPDQNIVEAWCDEALELNDADSAATLLAKILKTPVAAPSNGSSQAA